MGSCCAPEKKQDHGRVKTNPPQTVRTEPVIDVQQPENTIRAKEPDDLATAPRSSKEWYSLSNGDKYRGEWTEAHTIHGFGVYCYQLSGFRYEGEFDGHERHGYGIFTYENPNHRYEGHWDKGRRHGRGSYRMTDFSHYVGEFRDDLMHGRGVWQSPPPSSEYYEGEWMQGTKHGHGINVDTQDGLFAGHFNKGDRSGCAYFESGSVTRVGRWSEDYLHGPSCEWDPTSFAFIGAFDSGKRDGPGTLFFRTRDGGGWSRFVGVWRDGVPDGPGALLFCDGTAVYADAWDEGHGGNRTLPRSGQVVVPSDEVAAAAAAVAAAGGYQGLEGGSYGTLAELNALTDAIPFAPAWVEPPGSDPVRGCLDDPAIQLALTLSAALTRPPPVVHVPPGAPPVVAALAAIPFAFAYVAPPPVPHAPAALRAADAQLRANDRGLVVTPEALGRPAHVAAKLMSC